MKNSFHIEGKHMDLGEALKGHVETKLEHVMGKYDIRPISVAVTFAHPASHAFQSDIYVHWGPRYIRAHGVGNDAYLAFDQAFHKIEERMRHHKEKIRDKHRHGHEHPQWLKSQTYTIKPDYTDESMPSKMPIVAEMITQWPKISLEAAVEQLEFSDEPVIFFNISNNRLNIVHKRADGMIGWIDPHTEE